MRPDDRTRGVPRRNFLKGAGLAGAAAFAGPAARAQPPVAHIPAAPAKPNLVVETIPPTKDPVTQTSSGGDFMVDVLKSLELDYIAINPASAFRGLQEAIINYGKNSKPELLTCNHEEIAASMAQGYAKMEGKPMGVLAHGTVGLQHAAMALYNAFCDKVPVYVMIGNILAAEKRGPLVEWAHSAQDPAAIVRDFLKWDDQPASLQHFAESAVRAYKLAMTPPMAPVLLSLDAELQENPLADREQLRIPRLPRTTMPVGDPAAIAEAARLLVDAEFPVLVADRMARTQAGMDHLVALAETLQCAVIDQGGRTNFPSRHPLNHTGRARGVIAQADVVVGFELNDYWGTLHAFSDRIVRRFAPVTRAGAKTVSMGTHDLFTKANYQEFERFPDVDLAISGDGEATLPALIEAVKRLADPNRRATYDTRGKKLAAAQAAMLEELRIAAAVGWDASPITMGRLCAELYEQIRQEDWSLVGNGIGIYWPQRLWSTDRRYRFNGNSGGFGIGYNAPGALGAALANRSHGRLSVAIQGDGDLMFAPGTLWTAAHHRIPILYVMHNNRAYHQEYMYVQDMAGRHMRGIENAHVGTTLRDPEIDFATVAKGFGVYAEGPISDPKELGPALKRAIAVVKRGEPALLDTIVEPR
ncbi:MAG TPA: thiamine pyrophosphate-dependent enzyme [Stellaceae bacterium]|nr:thiamine pyrophosphate-dependent enzyme [Stellaceae bacterium]